MHNGNSGRPLWDPIQRDGRLNILRQAVVFLILRTPNNGGGTTIGVLQTELAGCPHHGQQTPNFWFRAHCTISQRPAHHPTIPLAHDAAPPPAWPEDVVYLTRSRVERAFPRELLTLLVTNGTTFSPKPVTFPAHLIQIKRVSDPKHPANGQRCLVAKKKLPPKELVIPYLGEIHATLTDAEGNVTGDPHAESDYDLSLLRLAAHHPSNPTDAEVSIGIDAAKMGNAARFVNDYRGIGAKPNCEFRTSSSEGYLRMEIWTLTEIKKGDELLISYGKGWWGARRDA